MPNQTSVLSQNDTLAAHHTLLTTALKVSAYPPIREEFVKN
ncbi:hypothetical protein [Xanthomonas sp. F4]